MNKKVISPNNLPPNFWNAALWAIVVFLLLDYLNVNDIVRAVVMTLMGVGVIGYLILVLSAETVDIFDSSEQE